MVSRFDCESRLRRLCFLPVDRVDVLSLCFFFRVLLGLVIDRRLNGEWAGVVDFVFIVVVVVVVVEEKNDVDVVDDERPSARARRRTTRKLGRESGDRRSVNLCARLGRFVCLFVSSPRHTRTSGAVLLLLLLLLLFVFVLRLET